MRRETREALNAYKAQIASLNSIEAADQKFNVDPSVQQKLESRQQESSDFLNRINIAGVSEQEGEKLGLGITGTIAGRTDTASGKKREPQDPTALDDTRYRCEQTNFDTALRYAKIDAWAKFPDFQTRIRDAIVQAQALDRIRIGWNGTSVAAETDRAANPNLDDVNIGWLEKMRRFDGGSKVMDGGDVGGEVSYGDHGDADYKSLDALVYDAAHTILPTWARNDTELVAIVGRDLLHDKYFPLINAERDPSEQVARDIIMSSKRLGNFPAVQVPFFREGTVFITRYDNLSLYWQEGARRRHIKDEPEFDRIANYESSNDSYVIEDNDYAVLIENIIEKPAAAA